ncbi:MAG: molybdopterin-dependent oxidoreductase [Pseudomonadales bacterium]|nr:molybdopterin-dependent oxidoreductase [Pseudomonadales bacterium]
MSVQDVDPNSKTLLKDSTPANTETHYRTCNICEALCGIAIEYQEDNIISIKGDKNDPFSLGFICPKATALQDIHEDPDRLKQPMKKTDNGWIEIAWEEAFDIVAEQIQLTQDTHGKDSVATYVGNPTAHNHGNLLMLKGFLDTLGSKNRYSATSVDQLPEMLAAMRLFGNSALFPIPDVDRMTFLIIMGGNPLASGGSFMSGPNINKRFSLLKERENGRLITIDPRFTETSEVATEHYYITPGKDAFLLLAILNVIFSDGTETTGSLPVENMNELKAISLQFGPHKISKVVDISADIIIELARELTRTKQAAIYGRLGTSTQEYGALCSWLIYVINIVAGNMDVEGGMMFTRPAIDVAGLGALVSEVQSFDTQRSRVRKLPDFAGEFPVATLADEMLTPGQGQIKMMITLAGNPVLSVPNGKKMENALSGLDYMVSYDMYINETTQYADIIIPPTSPLEHSYYALAIQMVAYRHTAKFSEALFEKPDGAYHEWQSMLEVMTRVYSKNAFSEAFAKSIRAVVLWLGDEGILNLLLKLGPYGKKPTMARRVRSKMGRIRFLKFGRFFQLMVSGVASALSKVRILNILIEVSRFGSNSFPVLGGLTIDKLKNYPHGIDIGPLLPVMPGRLNTRNKKINLAPGIYLKDINRLTADLSSSYLSSNRSATQSPFDLLLIGRRHVRSNNSWLHNSYRLVKGKSRCTVLMNKEDAQVREIENGQRVKVTTRVGSVKLVVETTDKIKKGVISIPHGWGHHRKDAKLSVAETVAGVSLNDITDDNLVDKLTGVAICNGVPAKVKLDVA